MFPSHIFLSKKKNWKSTVSPTPSFPQSLRGTAHSFHLFYCLTRSVSRKSLEIISDSGTCRIRSLVQLMWHVRFSSSPSWLRGRYLSSYTHFFYKSTPVIFLRDPKSFLYLYLLYMKFLLPNSHLSTIFGVQNSTVVMYVMLYFNCSSFSTRIRKSASAEPGAHL